MAEVPVGRARLDVNVIAKDRQLAEFYDMLGTRPFVFGEWFNYKTTGELPHWMTYKQFRYGNRVHRERVVVIGVDWAPAPMPTPRVSDGEVMVRHWMPRAELMPLGYEEAQGSIEFAKSKFRGGWARPSDLEKQMLAYSEIMKLGTGGDYGASDEGQDHREISTGHPGDARWPIQTASAAPPDGHE